MKKLIKTTVLLLTSTLVGAPVLFAQTGQDPQMKKVTKVAKVEPQKVAPPMPQPSASSENQAAVLNFLKWKSIRVHEAQRKLEKVGQAGPPQEKLTFNVDVALQLNIEDYFSIYMKNLEPEAFKAAAKQLTDEEVSELLLAHKRTLEKGARPSMKFSKAPKSKEKPKK